MSVDMTFIKNGRYTQYQVTVCVHCNWHKKCMTTKVKLNMEQVWTTHIPW